MVALKRCNKNASAISDLFVARVPHFDGMVVAYVPGQEVVGAGDPTENFFLVMDGLFRAAKFTADGRRQVFAFHMAGDLCGLERRDPQGDDRGSGSRVDGDPAA